MALIVAIALPAIIFSSKIADMPGFNAGWYIMYTRPQQEHKVARDLTGKNIEVYLPVIEKVRQWNDRKKIIKAPLFPSYVFIHLTDLKDYHESVTDNPGLLYFVKDGSKNAILKEEIINNIRFVLSKGQDLDCVSDHFVPGFEMTIRKGPFTGLNCQIVEHKSKLKVLISLQMINRSLLATIPISHLQ